LTFQHFIPLTYREETQTILQDKVGLKTRLQLKLTCL